jgi:hypothetical protein
VIPKKPDDESENPGWRARRPKHEPPHARFFEDGEEPPERYDLLDRTDYIEVNPKRVWSTRWFWMGLKAVRRCGYRVFWESFSYHAVCLVGYCVCGPVIQLLLGPVYHADLTIRWLDRFTGGRPWFKRRPAARGTLTQFALSNLAVQLSALVTIIGLFFLGFGISDAKRALFNAPRQGQSSTDAALILAFYIVAALALILIHAFIAVRVCGFATHLILDYDLGPIESGHANWRITSSRTWQLMCVKIALWAIKYGAGFATYGVGLVLLEPYCTAVWTAAYLDIAGSEPIAEKFAPSHSVNLQTH